MDHRTVTQNRQVEAITIERHELRVELRDLVAESSDQLLFGPSPDVRCTQRVYRPMSAFAVSDERADTHDGVVDLLREFVAQGGTNVGIGLANEVIGGREPAEIGHGLQVPNNDARFHL
jgi:hypothetical protein